MILTINPLYIIIPIIILILLLILFVLLKKKKKKKIKINQNFIDRLLNSLGNKENIININLDTNRIEFVVKDISKCNLEDIKELSNKGVLVINNRIKALFTYQSDILKKELQKVLKEV